MKLSALLQRKRLTLLGLNSGTSADGLDVAAVTIDRSRSGYRIKFKAGTSRKYPPKLRRAVIDLADSPNPKLEESIRLDQALGQFYGRAAAAYIKRCEKRGLRIDAIASHGQTVRHLPDAEVFAGYKTRGSLQLGAPEQIAGATGKVAVADFRPADIAAGNEGAPITGGAMHRLFSDKKESRLIVNIGGMSNFFYFPADSTVHRTKAADVGPGNVLSDLLCQALFRRAYDWGGEHAMSGKVSQRLLALLLAEPFFGSRAGSTGREQFGPELVQRLLRYAHRLKLNKADILATAAEVTPRAIADRAGRLIKTDPALNKLYLTGGGQRNRFFVKRLHELLNGLPVESIADLGYDPSVVEATAYAVMGEATLRGEPMSSRPDRSARSGLAPVLGRIVQPPRKV